MAKSKSEPSAVAKKMFDQFLSHYDPDSVDQPESLPEEKDPQAQKAGRIGGKLGGPARAATLSPKKRSQIARKAAKTRWAKKS